MRTLPSLLPKLLFVVPLVTVAVSHAPTPAHAQDGSEVVSTGMEPVIQGSQTRGGGFFSRELGTALRFNYHTEGYGTETGVVSLGSMKVFNMEGATWFFDGQGTLSDDFGGGFNAGIGYRELVEFNRGFDPQRILGMSFWTDGQSTSADNFFTQLSFGLESLGDSYDLRLNGYFPLDRTETSDAQFIDLGTPYYEGNELFGGIEQIKIDTAHSVVDGEFAKRVNDLEAWAFAGVYQLGGGGVNHTGYRAGVRGYAVPDLAVSLQVTDDPVYSTNVMFGITWFVGRTHRGNAPGGTLLDRFREPVLRNDFIATTQDRLVQASGDPLTDAETDAAFHIVHVDSDAAAGGDGTFENPYNTFAGAEVGQQVGSKVLVYSGSVLDGPFNPLDDVDVLGEGIDPISMEPVQHIVDSVELGTFALPETSLGSSEGATPIINGGGADVFTLANDNMINNFVINGAGNAVVASAVNAPRLANLDINNPTGMGINFTNVTGNAIVENTVTIDGSGGTSFLVDGGEDNMQLNAIITDSDASSLVVRNRDGGTITYGGTITDGDSDTDTATSIVIEDNEATTVNFTETIMLDTGDSTSVAITDNDVDSAVTFADLIATSATADTVFIRGGGTITVNDANGNSEITNTGDGDAVNIRGSGAANMLADISIDAEIANSGLGNAVDVMGWTDGDITFLSTVLDQGEGLSITGNSGGTIAFTDTVTANVTGANNAIHLEDNLGPDGGATISFNGMDLSAEAGTGFLAENGGTLVATGENNVTTTTGRAIDLNGSTTELEIGDGGFAFDTVTVTDGDAEGVRLANVQGPGTITLGSGDDPGDGGMLSTNMTAIEVDNVANLVVENIRVNNTAHTGGGISVTGQQEDSSAVFNNMDIDTDGATGVSVTGNDGGTIAFNDLDVQTATGHGVVLDDNAGATVTFDGMDVTTGGAGNAFAATMGGTVSVTGDANLSTVEGTAINMNGVTVAAAGVSFDSVNVTAGTGDGVNLTDLDGTGSVVVGADTAAPGTITTAGRGVVISGGANDITVNTGVVVTDAAGNSLVASGRTGGTVAFNSDVTDQGGMEITNNTGGTVNVTGDLTFNTGAGDAIQITGNDGGSVNFTTAGSINLGTTTGSGVHLSGTNTNVAIGADITGGTGTSLDIEGDATAVVTGDITSTAGNSVHVHQQTGGTVSINGDIDDTGEGILIDSNTGGTVNLGGNVMLNTGASDALTITNNSAGHTTNVTSTAQLDIDTDAGRGIVVSGAGAVNVDGTGHTIDTNTGAGIDVTNARSASFNGITVNTAGTNAVNVTHTVGTVSDVEFTNFTIESAADIGVNILANGTGQFDITLDDANISGVGQQGILLDTGANVDRVDFVLTGSTVVADDNSAFEANLDEGSGAIRFLIQDNPLLANNSATDAAVDISLSSGSLLSATIGAGESGDPDDPLAPPANNDSNRFRNTGGGDPFRIVVDDPGAVLNLDLRGNTAQGGTGEFVLTQSTGTFNLVDAPDTIGGANNSGTVNDTGTINNINPPVAQPTP